MNIKTKSAIISFLASFLILAITMNISTATTVEMVNPEKLPVQLHEGEQLNFTITIKDYEGAKQLAIETNLVPLSDKPLWDFGDSNPVINVNRYQQNIILDLASLPAILSVSISGKVPDGENKIKCDDTFLTKLQDTKLKFYEIRLDDKLIKIESFELIISKREDFEKTLQQIRWKEFDGIIREVRKIFNSGLTTEAQNIAIEMSNIRRPNSLLLFGLIPIEDNLLLNGAIISVILITFVIGYFIGSRPDTEENEI